MIVDPWGVVLARADDHEGLCRGRPRPRPSAGDRAPAAGGSPTVARGCRRVSRRHAREVATATGGFAMSVARAKNGPDKRRMILDAAVRVFARQGFHACRVSDIADEAGVAYGLVYHYFASKDEILDTLFLERWNVMLKTIRAVDARDELSARAKLHEIASFIVDFLPPRSRPDEGDHRRGHPRRQLLRSDPPRADPPGVRADRRDCHRGTGRRARSKPRR